MGWGTAGNVTVNNLGSDTDDPSQARAELYNALVELQAVIGGRSTANGVAPLNASTKIDPVYLPNEINSSTATDLVIDPDTGRVVIEDIIGLTPLTTAELEAVTASEGDIAYCSDGDGGDPCIAVSLGESDSQGSVWYRIQLGTQINDAS